MGIASWPAVLGGEIEKAVSSPTSISALAALARLVPRRSGQRVADLVAHGLAMSRHSRLMRALRLNQWVVSGELLDADALDRRALGVVRNTARAVFDLYHHRRSGDVSKLIAVDAGGERLTRRAEFAGRGLMVAMIHMSGFDLVFRWVCQQRIHPLVLTTPHADGGRRSEYEQRRQDGINMVPATVAGLREALRRLQQGGTVLTGIDRPIANPRLQPLFFGRASALPVHHIKLAMKSEVPVVVAAAFYKTDGWYHLRVSNAIEMAGDHRSDADVVKNAEGVLRVVEAFVRAAPDQWAVPVPVWPTAEKSMPA